MQLSECTPGTRVTVVNGVRRFNGIVQSIDKAVEIVFVNLSGNGREAYGWFYPSDLEPGLSGAIYDGPVYDERIDTVEEYNARVKEYDQDFDGPQGFIPKPVEWA